MQQHTQESTISPSSSDSDWEDYPSSVSSDSSPHDISAAEATFYYAGISPDPPTLVYRTGKTPWNKTTGPEAYRALKELREVFDHKVNDVWERLGYEVRNLQLLLDVILILYSIKVRDLLDEQKVLWTSVDVVRFRTGGVKAVLGPVVLWIGVLPTTLIGEDAFKSSNGLLELLKRYGITDVDIEYRESVYRRSAGPPLLESVSSVRSTVDVVGPLTAALGLHIASLARPHFQGTMGFYLAEGGQSKDILAVTARHVLFPLDEDNTDYVRANNSAPRKDVILMGPGSFKNLLLSIMIKIGRHGKAIKLYERQIQDFEERAASDDEDHAAHARQDLKKTRRLLDEANEAIGELNVLYKRTREHWSKQTQRIIGHVVHSPAITVGSDPRGFTTDYAVVKLDKEKFRKSFKGNVLDLGEFWYISLKPSSLTALSDRDGHCTPGFYAEDVPSKRYSLRLYVSP
jgi:hypothetical protein